MSALRNMNISESLLIILSLNYKSGQPMYLPSMPVASRVLVAL